MNQVHILVVDDCQSDAILFADALRESRPSIKMQWLSSGEAAIAYLLTSSSSVQVQLVVLDLQMPKIDGIETLRRIKKTPEIQNVPVVLFCSNSTREQIETAYASGAGGVVTKPNSAEGYIESISILADYWLKIVEPPSDMRH